MTESAPEPFGLMLRRPGDIPNPDAGWGDPDRVEGIYVAPDFTIRHTDWDAAGSDPRSYVGGENDWALSLPHRCGEWGIATGPLDDVLAEAARQVLEAQRKGADAELLGKYQEAMKRALAAERECEELRARMREVREVANRPMPGY